MADKKNTPGKPAPGKGGKTPEPAKGPGAKPVGKDMGKGGKK